MDGTMKSLLTRRSTITCLTLPFLRESILDNIPHLTKDCSGGVREASELSILNAITEGFTDVFDQPVEFEILKRNDYVRKKVALYLENLVSLGDNALTAISAAEYFENPKGTYGARRLCCAIEPVDSMYYLTLAILVARRVEASRPERTRNIIFSHRFAPKKGRLFDKRFNYSAYRRFVSTRRHSSQFLLKTDISNFYGSISTDHLLKSLLACGSDPAIAYRITALIDHWTGGTGGLPVGSNASRILAEAILIGIDREIDDRGISFCRYADDIVVFCDTKKQADENFAIISDAAQKYGLTLNISKTSMTSSADDSSILMNEGVPGVSRRKKIVPLSPSESPQIPMKFRPPRRSEYKSLFRLDLSGARSALFGEVLLTPWRVRRIIRAMIIQNDPEMGRMIPNLIIRYPEFTPYISSALLSYSNSLSKDFVNVARSGISEVANEQSTPLFVAVRLIRVLSTEPFSDRTAVMRFSENLMMSNSRECARASLMALRTTGGVPLEILDHVDSNDRWLSRETALSSPNAPRSVACPDWISNDPITASIIDDAGKVSA